MIDHVALRHRRARRIRLAVRAAQILASVAICTSLAFGASYFARAQEVATITPLSIPPAPTSPKPLDIAFDRDPMQPLVTTTISAQAQRVLHAQTPRQAMNLTNIRLCGTDTSDSPPGAIFFDGQNWIPALVDTSPFGEQMTDVETDYVVFADGTIVHRSPCASQSATQTTTDPYNLNPIGTTMDNGQYQAPQQQQFYSQSQPLNQLYGSPAPSSSVVVPGVSPDGSTSLGAPMPQTSPSANDYGSVYGQSAPTPPPYYFPRPGSSSTPLPQEPLPLNQ